MKKILDDKENKKITFMSLLFETIVGFFLTGTEPSEEQKEYTTKEKWKIWLSNTFDSTNVNTKSSKVAKVFLKILIIFLIINFFIFTPMVINQLKSPRYPVARTYLKSAFMVNQLYIIPLSKMFGYGNPLTWGFYPIKETLYKIGMSKLPKDEGEREIWWFNIRFVEFKMVVRPALANSFKRDTTFVPLPTWQVKSLKKWNNELYSHILSFPKAKISDSTYKKEKLMRFVDLAEAYESSTSILSTKLQVTKHNNGSGWKSYPDHLPNAKPEDVKNYMTMINLFNNFKTDSEKNEKESYDYFEQNKRYYEDKFLYATALDLLRSESQWGNLSCTSPEVKIFVTRHKNLRDFYIKNYNTLKPGEKGTIQILVTSGGLPEECKKEPSLSEFSKYSKRYSTSIENNLTMIEIFKDK